MSLARAFTKRAKRAEVEPSTVSPQLNRATSVRNPGQPFDRKLISGPIQLISTTNMLSYNAPDIVPHRVASSSSSVSSAHDHEAASDSDKSSTKRSASATLTDASSIDDSPTTDMAEPNHLSCYFKSAQEEQKHPRLRNSFSSGSLNHRRTMSKEFAPSTDAPTIPKRALSHSKSSHVALARKRSQQSMTAPTMRNHLQLVREREVRTSSDMFRGSVDPSHPFGKELEQLNEVAEEFGNAVSNAEIQADVEQMKSRKLAKFCATEYLAEIEPLFASFYPSPAMAWI